MKLLKMLVLSVVISVFIIMFVLSVVIVIICTSIFMWRDIKDRINRRKKKNGIEGTDINPNEIELMYKDGSIGVHDLYRQFGFCISYEKADELWGDYFEDIWHVSFKTFPKDKVKRNKKYAAFLFVQLYLYENNVVTNDETAEYLKDALTYAGFIDSII